MCAALAPLGPLPELACAPDSFDGIVGGVRDSGAPEASIPLRLDENLPAPRPIAPLSVSWVNATRVGFRWELAQGTTGARIELCRTRECDGESKTFDVEGAELLSPEDLATGFWFWRLYGKTADAVGTKPSASWEFVVRGGRLTSGNGTGSIVDVNGDGAPDLLVTVEEITPDAGADELLLLPLLGTRENPTRFTAPPSGALPVATSRTAVASSDLDGDGISDVASTVAFDARFHGVIVFTGSVDGMSGDIVPAITPPLLEAPEMREAGDIDLDGRGDVVISTSRDIFFVRGAATGLGATVYGLQLGTIDRDGGVPVLPAPMAIGAGHDRDGDGFPEVAFAWPFPGSPVGYLFPTALGVNFGPMQAGPPPKRGATAFADGDFDGAGLNDTAFATTIDGAPAVCILRSFAWLRKRPTVCWAPPSPAPAGFASSMTAGDLDKDGRDELVVGSIANGIWILRLADESITAEHLDVPYGARVTTLHPGRPGPAVWAATQPSGADIAIFVGTMKSATLPPPPPATRFGPVIR